MSARRPPAPAKGLLGRQEPTLAALAPYDSSEGHDALRLGEMAGRELDPWQQQTLIDLMGRRNGLWASFEFGIECSRRNGKSAIFEIRALAGLFLLGEQKIVWSAHRGDTAMEAFGRMVTLIEGSPSLKREIAFRGVKMTNGKEQIRLRTGQVMVFKTRVPGGGRGLDGDFVIIDEVQDAQDDHLAALLPAMAARNDPQVGYAGSSGGPTSYVQGSLVHRARLPEDDPQRERFSYVGWGAGEDDDPADPETWAKANPGLGRRLRAETMAGFYRAMRWMPDKFAAEHLGVGNYPTPAGEDWLIPQSAWAQMLDEESSPVGPVLFCAEGRPDQSAASIGIAGYRSDGATHLEVIAHERGTLWVPGRLAEVLQVHEHLGPVVMDPKGPLKHLIPDVQALGIEVHLLDWDTVSSGSEWFLSVATEQPQDGSIWQPRIRHRGQVPLTAALASAKTRTASDRVAISRRSPSDSSPLTSVVFAGAVLQELGRAPGPPPAPQTVDVDDPGTGTADLMTMQF